mmetsp:Transcript_22433/g.47237  ORF Transcript_22433/g.47237 Transcript_22433/m.47237 type:complete len:89 (-) Transcript_22433:231-497(-)
MEWILKVCAQFWKALYQKPSQWCRKQKMHQRNKRNDLWQIVIQLLNLFFIFGKSFQNPSASPCTSEHPAREYLSLDPKCYANEVEAFW